MLQDIDGNLNIFTGGNLNLLHLAIDGTDVTQAKISGSQIRGKSRGCEKWSRYFFFHLTFIKLYILFALFLTKLYILFTLFLIFFNKFFVLVFEVAFLFIIGTKDGICHLRRNHSPD